MQHGSGYGLDFYCPTEEYEKSVSFIFYTAGWTEGEKALPLSIPKFARKSLSVKTKSDLILFAMYEKPRYLYLLGFYPSSSNCLLDSVQNVFTFLEQFQKRRKLLIRLHPQQKYGVRYGWNIHERIKEYYGECNFDDFSKTFNQRLSESMILLSDNIGTTFLEAMLINKPTVIFLSKKIYRFRTEAQSYFDSLEKVNILHYSPNSAARHLNNVYDDVDSWWQSRELQEKRRAFVDRYARCEQNWMQEWVGEFNMILNN